MNITISYLVKTFILEEDVGSYWMSLRKGEDTHI
jgi:hypothetical protein